MRKKLRLTVFFLVVALLVATLCVTVFAEETALPFDTVRLSLYRASKGDTFTFEYRVDYNAKVLVAFYEGNNPRYPQNANARATWEALNNGKKVETVIITGPKDGSGIPKKDVTKITISYDGNTYDYSASVSYTHLTLPTILRV